MATTQDLKPTLRIVALVGLYGTLLMPNLYWPEVYFPFILPKALFTHALVGLTFPAYAVLAWIDPRYRPKKSVVYVAFAGYIATLFLSVMFAADPQRAFWGSSERMAGFFTILHFFAWMTMLSSTLKSWKEWNFFLNGEVFAITLCNVVGWSRFAQQEIDTGAYGGRRVLSYGNAAYLGEVQIVLLFLIAFLWRRTKNLWLKAGYAAAGVFGFYLQLSSGTRGALLGTVVGAIVVTAISIALMKNKQLRLALSAAGAALAGGYISVAFLGIGRQTALFKWIEESYPLVARAFYVVGGPGAGAVEERKYVWGMAWRGFLARPVTGWGLDNMHVVGGRFYKAESFHLMTGWPDQAHNLFLDILAMTGVVGFIGFSAVWLGMLVTHYRAWKEKKTDAWAFATLVGFMIGFLAAKAVLFEHITSFLSSAIIYALAIAAGEGALKWKDPDAVVIPAAYLPKEDDDAKGGSRKERRKKRRAKGEDDADDAVIAADVSVATPARAPVVLAVSYIAAAVLVFLTTVQPMTASQHLIRAYPAVQANPEVALRELRAGLDASGTYRYDIIYALSGMLMSDAAVANMMKSPAGQEILSVIRTSGREVLDQRKADARLWMMYGVYLSALGRQKADQALREEAEGILKHAVSWAPERPDFYQALASGQPVDRAVESMEKGIALDPSVGRSWWNMGLMYGSLGRQADAQRCIAKSRMVARPYRAVNASEAVTQARAVVAMKEFGAIRAIVNDLLVEPSIFVSKAPPQALLELARVLEQLAMFRDRDLAVKEAADQDPAFRRRIRPLLTGSAHTIDEALNFQLQAASGTPR